MHSALDLPAVQVQLDHAMALVPQDRWLLGAIRDGKLKVLADSSPESHRPYRRTRALTHLARRCLHERRPLTISAVAGAERAERSPDWEMDWPALLYAPVGMPGQRPLGLLTVGTRRGHWYQQHEIDYVAALAVTLTGPTLALGGPLARLSRLELDAARLIAEGLSAPEMSVALRLGVDEVRGLVGGVLRKLAMRSPGQLADTWARLDQPVPCP